MIPDFATLDRYVADHLLSRVDQGPLSIYNYTEKATYSGAWDAVTQTARGLILNRETGEVVARAFDKFFNHGERGIDAPTPQGHPDAVTVKHDGSLGILYRHEGRLRWSTRGSFYSVQAAVAEEIWAARWGSTTIPDDLTLLTEIVGPRTRNVVAYADDDLILLGVRNRHTGEDWAYGDVVEFATALGMRVTERVEGGLADLLARAAAMDHTEEGFVVRWGAYRVKVKSGEYMRVARMLAGLNDQTIADAWYAGKLAAYAALPEEHRDYIAKYAEGLASDVATVEAEFAAMWSEHGTIPDRKAFVMAIGAGTRLFSAAMVKFSGRDPDLRAVVYRDRFERAPRPI